jgi:hypothetical protein
MEIMETKVGRVGQFSRVFLTFLGLIAFTAAIAQADPINQLNASGTIIAGNGTVTITLNNSLTNAQVLSVGQNISALYFQVSGYSGSGASLSSSSGLTTNISGGMGTLGASVGTGWVVGNFGTGLTLCVICASPVQDPTAPKMTIVGGTGSGAYPLANNSINGNAPHNPFLVGPVMFTLNVPGVTANSTFSNLTVQFGTSATPPVSMPEPASLGLLLSAGALIFGGIGIKARRLT